MQASAVANQGLPRLSECPPSCDLACRTKKSPKIPSVLMVDLYASYRTVGVGLRLVSPSFLTISMVMTLIDAPNSTSTLNIYVKIPLLQSLRDVPIYARTVRDLCTKKPGRKPKDPPTVHVIGKLSALIT